MRVRLSFVTGLIASLALLGACAQEPEAYAVQDETPPPAVESQAVAPLAGGPSQDSRMAARQAADDAFVARMASKGLLAERRMDPDSGKMIWSISNRPVPNPVLRGGPNSYRHAGARQRSRSRGTISSGVYASNASSSRAASSAAQTSSSAAATASAAPSSEAAASAAETAAAPTTTTTAAAPTGPGVRPIPQDTSNIVDPARAGFEMTPMMWGIVALIVLALLAALFMANRPKARRPAYHANQAPPEASGGNHEPHHA